MFLLYKLRFVPGPNYDEWKNTATFFCNRVIERLRVTVESACMTVGRDIKMTIEHLNLAQAPLVIAVTGHRDLRDQDIKNLTDQVTKVLQELRAEFGSTPFVLLSPLAEGADRLVARVALALNPGINIKLVVPLPLPEEMYLKDFPNSIDEFKTLLSQGAKFDLPLLSPRKDIEVIPSAARNRQYEAVGLYLVRQCQILLALWDGEESEEMGATARVVRFQLGGIPAQAADNLQPQELFPVRHIVTPRQKNPSPKSVAFEIHEKYPEAFAAEGGAPAAGYYKRLFGNLKRYNDYVERGGNSLWQQAMKSQKKLMTGAVSIRLYPTEERDLNRYAVADAIAIRFHNYVRWANNGLQGLAFLAFLCFVIFAHIPTHPPISLVACFILFVLGYGAQKLVQYMALDSRSQDYRAMAEACRVKFFWRIAGIEYPIADNYLGMQRTELDWIRNGLRAWDMLPDKPEGNDQATCLEFLRTKWVDEQLGYFKEHSETDEKRLTRIEEAVKFCLRIAVALAVLVILLHVFLQLHEFTWWVCHECENWLHWMLIPIDLLLASAALLHHSLYRMALSQHIKQYKRMKIIFQNASELVKANLSKPTTVQECLRKLGQEALKENGDWVLLHRERPLELPHL